MTKMSLHRVIAEIKATEQKLANLYSTHYVFIHTGEENETSRKAKIDSQSNFDKTQSLVTNLAALKSARNRANSNTTVTIAGKTMTIDEALAQKVAIEHKRGLVQALQNQFNHGEQQLKQKQDQIEEQVQKLVTASFGGTRKATEDEIKVLRSTVEATKKPSLIHADGLKDQIAKLQKEIEDFETEVDYTLSEANATTVVEVKLS